MIKPKRNGGGRERPPLRYASSFHAPALCQETVERLVTDRAGTYVDATLGGGGHSEALLEALRPEGRVIGIDRDPEALAAARERLAHAERTGRFEAVRGDFGELQQLLRQQGLERVAGVLLDLGVSSHQIDAAERGFSYREEGALDMRMDPRSGRTAEQVVNEWSEDELRDVFYRYGEESRAPRIARAIIAARPLETTTELADVVRQAVPTRKEVSTLSRVFQALRIAVNNELEVLERALRAMPALLVPEGRVAVISYHSLEDRRVKRFFRYGNFEGEPARDIYGNLISPWHEVTRSPVRPSSEEVEANPRSRSARLRVAARREEIPDEWTP